eukprot:Rhum_TRINITY_DN14643_c18_g1::Rhum_TRINITY_DN14643_c18_g1_i1::g.107477::m.107477
MLLPTPPARTSTLHWCRAVRTAKCARRGSCGCAHVDEYAAAKRSSSSSSPLHSAAAAALLCAAPSLTPRASTLLRNSYVADLCALAAEEGARGSGVYRSLCADLARLGWRVRGGGSSGGHGSAAAAEAAAEEDVCALLTTVAQAFHYDLSGSPDIMLQTVLLVEAAVSSVACGWCVEGSGDGGGGGGGVFACLGEDADAGDGCGGVVPGGGGGSCAGTLAACKRLLSRARGGGGGSGSGSRPLLALPLAAA